MTLFPDYPVARVADAVVHALQSSKYSILSAETGSGKTTLLPLLLREKLQLKNQKMIILEPRRLAAKMAATRMAQLLGEPVGKTVGFRVRNETCVSSQTQIEVMTEGILTRLLQNDSALSGVGLIVFDEFHERSIHSDLALALTWDMAQTLRYDLQILVMSATLDSMPLATMLNHAPIIECPGKKFQVSVDYLGEPERNIQSFCSKIIYGIFRATHETSGDILVFLPGFYEINKIASLLEHDTNYQSYKIFKLHSSIPKEEQNFAVNPIPNVRKIILSSSIAESSLTIAGVTAVVDSCLERTNDFFPGSGMNRLTTQRASQSSLIQRQGRAGRLGPGKCYRATDLHIYATLPRYRTPEILRSDLSNVVLELAQWGCAAHPDTLLFLDPLPCAHYAMASRLLQEIDALDVNLKITPMGHAMVQLPLHPRFSHMILQSQKEGKGGLACDLAAILSEPDPMYTSVQISQSDIRLRMSLIRGDSIGLAFDKNKAIQLRDAANQLRKNFNFSPKRTCFDDDACVDCLLFAFPDRVARRRANQPLNYLLSNGRAVSFKVPDPLAAYEFLIIPHYDDAESQGSVRLACPVTESEIRDVLRPHFQSVDEIFWNDKNDKLAVRNVEKLGALIFLERFGKMPSVSETYPYFKEQILKRGLGIIPAFEKVNDFRNRVNLLHATPCFSNDFPNLSDEILLAELDLWLPELLEGKNSFSQITGLALREVLQTMLSPMALAQLPTLTPDTFTVPSGSKIKIHYDDEHAPKISVRLQELFGLFDTPMIAKNTIPVTIEMLSPGMRQVQLTRDLRSFWREGYFYVRKDLRGRYPKHYWPEDPLNAEAIKGSRKKLASK